ncbi:MAG: porin family protein [Bacteroidota bacterium]
MKKIIIMLLVILPALFSAETMFGQFNLGIKVGYNASKLSTGLQNVSSDFRSGFQFGAFARIGKKVYLQPELYYTTQGGVFSSDSVKNPWKQTVTIGSMDVPVLLGFKIINAKVVNLRILAGPMASFVVNKSVTDGGLNNAIGPLSKGDFKSVNWSLQAGAGVDVLMFTLDVRYQVGLNQLVSEVKNYKFDSKNNVWVISLGWKIL